jgi:hypothetical protein
MISAFRVRDHGLAKLCGLIENFQTVDVFMPGFRDICKLRFELARHHRDCSGLNSSVFAVISSDLLGQQSNIGK